MCWSMTASVAMVGLGAAATAVSIKRRDTPAVPATIAYFTFMEALQAVGYGYVDACGMPENQILTLLSYLHIVFQPFFINALAMAIIAGAVSLRMRSAVFLGCGISSTIMLVQLYPFDWSGPCTPGTALCGEILCLIRGNWHIGWTVPYNDALPALWLLPEFALPFPSYMVAAFGLPLLYGAWRFALFQLLAGPGLASLLTTNPNEMPAVWCLFSIGLVLCSLHPWLRRHVGGAPPPAMRTA
jgi:hypothetical protein